MGLFKKTPEQKQRDIELKKAERHTYEEAYKKGRIERARKEGYRKGIQNKKGIPGLVGSINAGLTAAENFLGVEQPKRKGKRQEKHLGTINF